MRALQLLKKYWYYAGRWHYAECDFILYDEGICGCPGSRQMIAEIKDKINSLQV